ncbi:hypothetical protein CHS0354_039427 [Potamilus streckersoni]|uniref:LRAT domain-containing protein n=1 Tax=Potamilus streckersoni TaxID=2493646 RepID=A0AAE0VNX1_9BIVA|nr:hypothetical protein CHS0354_039427 [Potamilus streckersoni]
MDPASVRRYNQNVLNSLEEGDLVEFPRCIYSHWAVYIGNEEVVHLAGDPNARSKVNANLSHVLAICGKESTKAIVKRDNFFDVAADSKEKRNNAKDFKVRNFKKRRSRDCNKTDWILCSYSKQYSNTPSE